MSAAATEGEAFVARSALLKEMFSWRAVSGASVVAVATTITLLILGSGIGLALTPRQGIQPSYLTLGAIFFLCSEAFGLAVGGHVVGRLIGPALETANEENFRAGAHGLAVWALSIVITLLLVAATGSVAGKATVDLGVLFGSIRDGVGTDADQTSYLVDVLFRPDAHANAAHASLDFAQFAQVTNGTASDAAQSGTPDQNEVTNAPTPLQGSTSPTQGNGEQQGGESNFPSNTDQQSPTEQSRPRAPQTSPGDLAPTRLQANPPDPAQLAADKAEVGRILNVASQPSGSLAVDDRDRIAQLVAQDANISYETATGRANDALGRMERLHSSIAQKTRAAATFISLWLAASLIFGALVSVIAAVSARWEDDMQAMFLFRQLLKR